MIIEHRKVGVRVNPNAFFRVKKEKSGSYPLCSYLWFSAENKLLMEKIYSYFGSDGNECKSIKNEQAFLEPDMLGGKIATPEIYFMDAKAVNCSFRFLLAGHNLIDIRTKQDITLDDLFYRAESIMKNIFSNSIY